MIVLSGLKDHVVGELRQSSRLSISVVIPFLFVAAVVVVDDDGKTNSVGCSLNLRIAKQV